MREQKQASKQPVTLTWGILEYNSFDPPVISLGRNSGKEAV